MKSFRYLFVFLALLGCSQYISTEKLRDVKKFYFEIHFGNFSNESGITTQVSMTQIKRWSVSPRYKTDTTNIKLTSKQVTQIKNALDRIPFSKIKKEYRDERVVDGGVTSFKFDIDEKKYEMSYINYPLHPNLQQLEDLIKKIIEIGE